MYETGLLKVSVKPIRQIVEITHTARFVATVKGVGPFYYQWRRGKQNLTHETQSTLVINKASLIDRNGYRCYVTNDYGDSVLSKRVFLDVIGTPTF